MNGRKKKLAEGQEGGHHVCSPKRAVFVRVFVCLWCLWFVHGKSNKKKQKNQRGQCFFFLHSAVDKKASKGHAKTPCFL